MLVADCVAKSFGDRRVLTSASLRAVEGELRVLFGRNGAGKSTLMKIAAGWTQPDSGSVFVDGRALEHTALAALARRGVLWLPDEGLLSNAFTVRRQLDFFAARWGGDAGAAAERVGITHLVDRAPCTLSGGERRRAELAVALVRRPRVLLADEPYRGVAPLDAEVLTRELRALTAAGCAVVVTGHEAPTLLDAADHVTWCTNGTTRELGPPAVAAGDEWFEREYLGFGWRAGH